MGDDNTKAKLTVALVALRDIASQPAFEGKSSESRTAMLALETIRQFDAPDSILATQPQEQER
jgi:hypothetical protein